MYLNKIFLWACRNGYAFIVSLLFNTNVNHRAGFFGAVYNNQINVIERYLESVNSDYVPVIELLNDGIKTAANIGNLEIVKLLFNFTNNDSNYNALDEAIINDHIDIVKFLVTSGVDINYRTDATLRKIVFNGCLKIFNYLIDSGFELNDEYLIKTCCIMLAYKASLKNDISKNCSIILYKLIENRNIVREIIEEINNSGIIHNGTLDILNQEQLNFLCNQHIIKILLRDKI